MSNGVKPGACMLSSINQSTVGWSLDLDPRTSSTHLTVKVLMVISMCVMIKNCFAGGIPSKIETI